MPLKPLAPKASVFNSNFVADHDVAPSVATEPDFTKDGFYNKFFKMLGYFYGDIAGLEGASSFVPALPFLLSQEARQQT